MLDLTATLISRRSAALLKNEFFEEEGTMRKVFSLVSVAVLLAVSVPLAGAQMARTALHVDLTPTMYATDAGLGSVTGSAHVQPEDGYLTITLQPNGTELPAGTVLEGWLVDAGLGGSMDMAATDDMMATPDETTHDDMTAIARGDDGNFGE